VGPHSEAAIQTERTTLPVPERGINTSLDRRRNSGEKDRAKGNF
jgi:hypothetical protein